MKRGLALSIAIAAIVACSDKSSPTVGPKTDYGFGPVSGGQTREPATSWIFNLGIDGAVTWDGVSTVLGFVPSGSVYTLTRPVYCSGCTYDSGVTISTQYPYYDNGTAIIGGGSGSGPFVFANDAAAAVGSAAGVALPAHIYAIGAAGGVGNGAAGGASGSAACGPYVESGNGGTAGVVGGNGGNGGTCIGGGGGGAAATNAGGSGGALTVYGTIYACIDPTDVFEKGVGHVATSTAQLTWGTGGGGGGSDVNYGGGGGGAGQNIFVAMYALSGSGSLVVESNGGAGASAVGVGGGGGGGGGGGDAMFVFETLGAVPATVESLGGSGGAGNGGGNGGSGGNCLAKFLNLSGDGTAPTIN